MNINPEISRAREQFQAANLSRARRICERVLSADPKNGEAYDLLGSIEIERGRFALALPLIEKAVATETASADIYARLGLCHQALRQVREALAAYGKALKLDPKHYLSLFGSGACLVTLGEIPKAQASLEKAIKLSNRYLEPYRLLATMTDKGQDKAFLKNMIALAAKMTDAPATEQSHLHFAIASAYEKQGNAKGFEEHTVRANSLLSAIAPAWYPANQLACDLSEQVFTRELLGHPAPDSAKRFTPIFIVGLPRSGSTLVEQILASHSKISAGDEMPFIRRFFVEDMTRDKGQVYPKFVPGLSDEEKIALAKAYQDKVAALVPGAVYITDKMVGNSFFVGMIRLTMPWAKVIHVKRDPRDTAFSMFSRYFDASIPFANDLGEMAKYFRLYVRFMDLWERVCPGFVHEVRYEDLVGDLVGEAKKMIKFCGLKWDPACLDFHKTTREVFTLSSNQVRQEVYSSSIGRWRDHKAMLEPFSEGVRDLLKNYGYPD